MTRTLALVFALFGYSLGGPLKVHQPIPTTPPAPELVERQLQVTTIIDPSCGTKFLPATGISNNETTLVTWPDATVCTCGELTLDFSTHVDKTGGNSVYCANEGTTVAQGVAPAAAWQSVSCSYGTLVDDEEDVHKRWNDSQATAAWVALVNNWKQDKPDEPFNNYAQGFFDWHDDPNCDVLDNVNCQSTITCGSAFSGGNQGETNSPAGMIIYNSFVGLHTVFEDTYAAFRDSLADGLAMIGDMVKDFSSIEDEIKKQQHEKIILDVVLGCIVFCIAPLLHFGLGKRVAWFSEGSNANLFGSIVDSVYGALGAIMAGVKDAMESMSPLPIITDVMSAAQNITDGWEQAIEDMNRNLFDDPEKLGAMIHDGQFLDPEDPPDPSDSKRAAVKGLVASLLPAVWMASESPKWPAVIVQDGLKLGATCEETDIASYGKGEGGEKWYQMWYEDDVNGVGKTCGPDGNAYWFAGIDPQHEELYSGSVDNIHVGTPGDISALDGKKYGGLNKVEMLMNAVNAYRANDNSNNWKVPDPTDQKFLETLVDGDLSKSWGLVKLPVCSMQQMVDTVRADMENDQGNPNYPCPK